MMSAAHSHQRRSEEMSGGSRGCRLVESNQLNLHPKRRTRGASRTLDAVELACGVCGTVLIED